MREETRKWLEQAKQDLDSAEKNLGLKKHYVVAFFCQQAVEKALKAVILNKSNKSAIGHSLVYLGKIAEIPKEHIQGLEKLSPQYFLSRYPDASEEIPYKLYDEDTSKLFLKTSRDVLTWTNNQLE